MRQLYIAGALFLVFLIGCYYMLTQRLNLEKFYPPSYVRMNQNIQPAPLLSPRPGPTIAHFAAPQGTPHPPAHLPAKTGLHSAIVHTALRTPPPLIPPAITPLPVPLPTYASVTPPPPIHTVPPIKPNVPGVIPSPMPTST
jgi:hypothetical protein